MKATGHINKETFDSTTLSPIGAFVLLPLLAVVLCMSRRAAVAAFFAAVCFVSDGQRISLAGLDFTPLRLLIAAGVLRVLARGEYRQFRWQTIDTLVACYLGWGYIGYAIQYGFDPSAMIRRAGELYTYAGTFFLCRCWLRDADDVAAISKAIAILAIPSACFFLAEWMTGRNIFSIFGGVQAITNIRDGRLRCQGPFPHALMAGAFWAGTVPLIASLWFRKGANRALCLAGLGGALLAVASCSSSTPILAIAVMCAGGALFYVRRQIRLIQLGVIGGLFVIHFAGSKPVWHLFARVNVIGGSTGYHRFFLIDNAIKHFNEWGMVGTGSTGHWGHMMWDITNQFLLEGVRAGFLGTLLFTSVLLTAFYLIGKAAKQNGKHPAVLQSWLVGVALLGHAVTFFSVSYYGQVPVIYWSTLAAAVAVSSAASFKGAKAAARRVVYLPAATVAALQAAGGSLVVSGQRLILAGQHLVENAGNPQPATAAVTGQAAIAPRRPVRDRRTRWSK